jgi:hypothetical protein
LWERALSLGEPEASLEKEGEGAAADRPVQADEQALRRPVRLRIRKTRTRAVLIWLA